MPWCRDDYPPEWEEMRASVLLRANDECEWCGAVNGYPHPDTGSRVVLTIAHLYDDDKDTRDLSRLAALCQKCHLNYDRPKHLKRAAETRRRKRIAAGQLVLVWEKDE